MLLPPFQPMYPTSSAPEGHFTVTTYKPKSSSNDTPERTNDIGENCMRVLTAPIRGVAFAAGFLAGALVALALKIYNAVKDFFQWITKAPQLDTTTFAQLEIGQQLNEPDEVSVPIVTDTPVTSNLGKININGLLTNPPTAELSSEYDKSINLGEKIFVGPDQLTTNNHEKVLSGYFPDEQSRKNLKLLVNTSNTTSDFVALLSQPTEQQTAVKQQINITNFSSTSGHEVNILRDEQFTRLIFTVPFEAPEPNGEKKYFALCRTITIANEDLSKDWTTPELSDSSIETTEPAEAVRVIPSLEVKDCYVTAKDSPEELAKSINNDFFPYLGQQINPFEAMSIRSQRSGRETVKQLLAGEQHNIDQFKLDVGRGQYYLNDTKSTGEELFNALNEKYPPNGFNNMALLLVQTLSADIAHTLNAQYDVMDFNSPIIKYTIRESEDGNEVKLIASYVFAQVASDPSTGKSYSNFIKIDREISMSKEDFQTDWSDVEERNRVPSLTIQDRYSQATDIHEIFDRMPATTYLKQYQIDGDKINEVNLQPVKPNAEQSLLIADRLLTMLNNQKDSLTRRKMVQSGNPEVVHPLREYLMSEPAAEIPYTNEGFTFTFKGKEYQATVEDVIGALKKTMSEDMNFFGTAEQIEKSRQIGGKDGKDLLSLPTDSIVAQLKELVATVSPEKKVILSQLVEFFHSFPKDQPLTDGFKNVVHTTLFTPEEFSDIELTKEIALQLLENYEAVFQ